MTELRVGYAGFLETRGTCHSRLLALQSFEARVFPLDVNRSGRSFLTRALSHLPSLSWEARELNATLLRHVKEHELNVVWIDKGSWVFRATLRRLHEKGVVTVHHLTDALWPDSARLRFTRRQLVKTALDYDYYITSNEQDVVRLRATSRGEVVATQLGYDDRRFTSTPIAAGNNGAAHDIVFIGHREPHTEQGICALIQAGLPVSVFGRNWIERAKKNPVLAGRAHDALGDEAYVATLQRAKIGLCFVSHWNYNQTAGRSYEIPACGTFLLAMRTAGHLEHYREGEEAQFFDSEAELVAKARCYLADEPARKRVAASGHRRCVDSGYSWREIMQRDWAVLRPRITARLGSR